MPGKYIYVFEPTGGGNVYFVIADTIEEAIAAIRKTMGPHPGCALDRMLEAGDYTDRYLNCKGVILHGFTF